MKRLLLVLFAMLSSGAIASIIPSTSDLISQQTNSSNLIIKSSLNASKETRNFSQQYADFILKPALHKTSKSAYTATKNTSSVPYPAHSKNSKVDSQLISNAVLEEHAFIASVKQFLQQSNAWRRELSDSLSGILGKPTLIEELLISADQNDEYLAMFSSEESFTHWSKFDPPKLDFANDRNTLNSFIAPNPLASATFTSTPHFTAGHYQLPARNGSNQAERASIPITDDTSKPPSFLAYLFELMEKVWGLFK